MKLPKSNFGIGAKSFKLFDRFKSRSVEFVGLNPIEAQSVENTAYIIATASGKRKGEPKNILHFEELLQTFIKNTYILIISISDFRATGFP